MEARGKVIASASAPRSNYREDLNAGWFNFTTRLNVDLSTQNGTQCLAPRPASNPRASCIHTMDYTLTVLHVFYAHAFVTQRGMNDSPAKKKEGGEFGGTHSARGPHETICH